MKFNKASKLYKVCNEIALLLLLIAVFCHKGRAQFLHIGADQQVTVQREALMTIHGGVKNEGTLNHEGDIIVTQDWTINGTYNSQDGWLSLRGAGIQQINNNSNAIPHLDINGEGDKHLLSGLTINNSLNLENGLLITNNHEVLLKGGADLFGGNENSYINGMLYHEGLGAKRYPVGDSSQYAPVQFEDITGTNPVIGVRSVEDSVTGTQGSLVKELIDERYWEFSLQSGTYDSSVVTLPVVGDEGFERMESVIIVQSDNINGTFTNIRQSDFTGGPAGGTVTSLEGLTESIFTLAVTSEFSLEGETRIASAFAPDGTDPKDRKIKVYGKNIAEEGFSFIIYNRWNEKVYETKSIQEARNEGWDGTLKNNGKKAPMGVYTYILRGKFQGGKSFKKTGNITLFR